MTDKLKGRRMARRRHRAARSSQLVRHVRGDVCLQPALRWAADRLYGATELNAALLRLAGLGAEGMAYLEIRACQIRGDETALLPEGGGGYAAGRGRGVC